MPLRRVKSYTVLLLQPDGVNAAERGRDFPCDFSTQRVQQWHLQTEGGVRPLASLRSLGAFQRPDCPPVRYVQVFPQEALLIHI